PRADRGRAPPGRQGGDREGARPGRRGGVRGHPQGEGRPARARLGRRRHAPGGRRRRRAGRGGQARRPFVKISEVCIDRPVLASVRSLVIVLFGAIALSQISNRELPDVDEPVVSVTTVYPGAAPEVVETSVTQPLEDQLIGFGGG